MDIVFLGTGSMIPTKERAQTAIFMRYRSENFLFDCGEGVQRQLRIAGISPARITRVLITHWHGDHFLGLPGLLENMAKHKEEKEIDIYGPRGTRLYLKRILEAFVLRYKIKIIAHEISKDGVFLEGEDYVLRATHVKHGISCVSYTFEEKKRRRIKMDYLKKIGVPEGPILKPLQEGKSIMFRGKKIDAAKATEIVEGKKVAVVLDTKICKEAVRAAKDADVLICESTFDGSLGKKAREQNHMTAVDAGRLAKKAKVGKLVLTHFSQRYKDTKVLLEEAKKEFKNTVLSEDFMKLEV